MCSRRQRRRQRQSMPRGAALRSLLPELRRAPRGDALCCEANAADALLRGATVIPLLLNCAAPWRLHPVSRFASACTDLKPGLRTSLCARWHFWSHYVVVRTADRAPRNPLEPVRGPLVRAAQIPLSPLPDPVPSAAPPPSAALINSAPRNILLQSISVLTAIAGLPALRIRSPFR